MAPPTAVPGEVGAGSPDLLSLQSRKRSAQPEVRPRVSLTSPDGWFLRRTFGEVTRWRIRPRKQD